MQKVRFGLTLSNRGVLLGLTRPDELLEMACMGGSLDQQGQFKRCVEEVLPHFL